MTSEEVGASSRFSVTTEILSREVHERFWYLDQRGGGSTIDTTTVECGLKKYTIHLRLR